MRCRFQGFLDLHLATSLLIAPGPTSPAPHSSHVGMALPREEPPARPRPSLSSPSSPSPHPPHSSFTLVHVLLTLIFHIFLMSFLGFLRRFTFGLAGLLSIFYFSISFHLSFYLYLSSWLVDRSLVQASLRGLENLGNLGRIVEARSARSGSPSAGNLGREVRKEDAEEANRN